MCWWVKNEYMALRGGREHGLESGSRMIERKGKRGIGRVSLCRASA